MRRAAISVSSNIAEGAADRTNQQFSNFFSPAIGSLNEMDTQLELTLRLAFLSRAGYDHLFKILDECVASLTG